MNNKTKFYCWPGILVLIYFIVLGLIADTAYYLLRRASLWATNGVLLFVIAYIFAMSIAIFIIHIAGFYFKVIIYDDAVRLRKIFTSDIINRENIQFYVRAQNEKDIDGVILKDGKRFKFFIIGPFGPRYTEIINIILKVVPAPVYRYNKKYNWDPAWFIGNIDAFQKE